MYRRLFYLLPNKAEAMKAVSDLINAGVKPHQMHTLAKSGRSLEGLPAGAPNLQRNMLSKMENTLWNLNLGIFFIALFVLVMSFISHNNFLVAVSMVVMVANSGVAYYYLSIPTIHLTGFHVAFQHGEILLMIDVPKEQVVEIEHILYQKDPSASEVGNRWSPRNLGLNL